MDQQTSIAELRNMVAQFVGERDWEKFHSPKNLSMALAIEVSELMEHFQWISTDESRQIDDEEELQLIREELADVTCYVLAIANEMDIDLSQALAEKMKKNRLKYPVDEYRGRYGPKDLAE